MAASTVICREGEIGEIFYVVVSGVVSVQVKGIEVATLRTVRPKCPGDRVTVRSVRTRLHLWNSVRQGTAFGELSLTGDTDEARKRNATVVAKTADVLLGTLDRGMLQHAEGCHRHIDSDKLHQGIDFAFVFY